MKIIKRNGAEVGFDITKIIIAITKANESVEEVDRMTPVQIQRIAESVDLQCQKMNRAPTVEEIQDMVEHYHGPRRFRGGQALYHLPLHPFSGA